MKMALQTQSLKTISALRRFARRAQMQAAITQLVECLAVNQNVTGSSPVGGVFNLFLIVAGCSLVRLERPAHKRAVTGSNPVRP